MRWLEAVCVPKWWQLYNIAEGYVDGQSLQLVIRIRIATYVGLSAEAGDKVVYPERLLNAGIKRPLPLIKIFDNHGRWCGWLCDSTAAILNDVYKASLKLFLLSTCAARRIFIINPRRDD